MSDIPFEPIKQIAAELALSTPSTAATIRLLEEGNTIPFIARYRKEVTHNLDETQIRAIEERLKYLKDMHERRQSILASIESQGKLSDGLLKQLLSCTNKNELEDLYLPFKPKRRTRAAIAREKGLEPLALRILEQPLKANCEEEALAYLSVDKGVENIESALSGARDIVAEMISENAVIRAHVREVFLSEGIVVSKVIEGKNAAPTKFEQYYDFKEPVAKIPSHRYLAIRRGEREGILDFHVEIASESILKYIQALYSLKIASPYAIQLEKAAADALKRLILPSVETDVRIDLKLNSDRAAVDIFAENLRNLLLASPLGEKNVIGIDPGLRTGCKCAIVDDTGKFLSNLTLYLCQGDRAMNEAKHLLLELVAKFHPFAIGIGNGTGGRETEAFVRKTLADAGVKHIVVLSVSEAGASVYSASEIAREEFPDLDLTIRGAISIARRLQDPLAELVKVDPKAIGVGQYQHDVHQPLLHDKLYEVVESCVNKVGVELNTASAALLSHVAGIGAALAEKIVKFREKNGAFKSRRHLLEVPGLGARTFEQAAGFLRVRNGSHPLDSSAVHPERYALVAKMAQDLSVPLESMIANLEAINRINLNNYFSADLGEHTLKDIIEELKKPGRDPRAVFEATSFRDDVHAISDLKIGMKLDGIVTNVTAFGAFVDIGVHQDGLIHISELTDRFITDPSEVVQTGTKIKVEVLTIDIERKRIALSARIGRPRTQEPVGNSGGKKASTANKPQKTSFGNNPFASL